VENYLVNYRARKKEIKTVITFLWSLLLLFPFANMPPRHGNRNFTMSESMNMLRIMNNILPIGGDDWLAVLAEHSLDFPGREVDSLRRKFSILHRKKVPTGDPRCPLDVKLAKRIKYEISSRADIGDGEEEMDLASGSFTNITEDGTVDEEANNGGEDEDDTEEQLEVRLADEVDGEFDLPNIPGDHLLLLTQRDAPPPTRENTLRTAETPALAASLAARSASSRSASEASLATSARIRSTAALASTRPVVSPATGATSSRGSNAPRPLVAPAGDRARGSRNNPQQDGLMQMMQMSMLQHNQHMDEERHRRVEEREARLAMQQMFATIVGGAFAAINKYTKNKDDKDDEEEEEE
jgi:hypothetical protein